MSDRVEKRLIELLDRPQHSPYGNPIPGLEELGDDRQNENFLEGVVAVTALAEGVSQVVVRRLGEPIQTDIELLSQLEEAGVVPGATVRVTSGVREVVVGAEGAETELELPEEFARHIFVTSL